MFTVIEIFPHQKLFFTRLVKIHVMSTPHEGWGSYLFAPFKAKTRINPLLVQSGIVLVQINNGVEAKI